MVLFLLGCFFSYLTVFPTEDSLAFVCHALFWERSLVLGLLSVSVPVTAVTGTASFRFISKLPVFILCERCFLKKPKKLFYYTILCHQSPFLVLFGGERWSRDSQTILFWLRLPLLAFCPCCTPRSHDISHPHDTTAHQNEPPWATARLHVGYSLSAWGFASGAARVKLTSLGSSQPCHLEPQVCPQSQPDPVACEEALNRSRAVSWGICADCRQGVFLSFADVT